MHFRPTPRCSRCESCSWRAARPRATGRDRAGAAGDRRPGRPRAGGMRAEGDPVGALGGQAGASPDRLAQGERVYFSRPLSVRVLDEVIRIERERVVLPGEVTGAGRWRGQGERDVIELARVSEESLWREAAAAGLQPEPTRLISETEEHTASEVVMLRG